MKQNVAVIAWTIEVLGFALIVTAVWCLWELARRRSAERRKAPPPNAAGSR